MSNVRDIENMARMLSGGIVEYPERYCDKMKDNGAIPSICMNDIRLAVTKGIKSMEGSVTVLVNPELVVEDLFECVKPLEGQPLELVTYVSRVLIGHLETNNCLRFEGQGKSKDLIKFAYTVASVLREKNTPSSDVIVKKIKNSIDPDELFDANVLDAVEKVFSINSETLVLRIPYLSIAMELHSILPKVGNISELFTEVRKVACNYVNDSSMLLYKLTALEGVNLFTRCFIDELSKLLLTE